MLDARQRVSGRLSFVADIELPGMLHARLLRSTRPHARLARVDVAAARSIPGVAAVLTGEDVLAADDVQPTFGPALRDQPLLAYPTVRFVGDPIVAVAADSLDIADAAVQCVEVDYHDLLPVFDVESALAPEAPRIHDEPPRPGPTMADIILHPSDSNLCNQFTLRHGDVSTAFEQADEIFEDTFSTPAAEHVPFETHTCLASFDADRLTVWATTQTPHNLRAQLAEIFGLPLGRVRVLVPSLGGAFGSKCYTKIEPITALLARLTRRPVRLHLTREEQAVTLTRHAAIIRMRTGARRDGTLVARQTSCYFNTGAYADIGPRLIKNGGYGSVGPYNIANVNVDSFAVYTNLPPAGAFRGYGAPQGAWAYETQIDMIAARLGLDPLELRLRNVLRDGQQFATGETIQEARFAELLRIVAERIDWRTRKAPLRDGCTARGIGFACALKGSVAPSTSTATAKLNEDGSLDILTSSVEMGQGLQTALAIIASGRLGIPLHHIQVSHVDTLVTPYDQQTSASRSTHAMGAAVGAAVDEVREQLLHLGADMLEVGPADLRLGDGQIRVAGARRRALSIADVMRRSRRGNLLGNGTFQVTGGLDPDSGQGRAAAHWNQAAGAAEVEVDLETGKVRVVRYEAAVFAGRVVNPVQARLQTQGSVLFGLGQALFEEMVFDGGQLQNANLGEYMLPSFLDVPQIGVTVLEAGETIYGLGETSLPPVAPAVGNAVYRATGVRIRDLPITPEKVLRELRAS
jgi:CO/xanthine dehydrogenase Mo-binding subunit